MSDPRARALQSIARDEALLILRAAALPIRPLGMSLRRTLADPGRQHACRCGAPIRRRTKQCMSCSKRPGWYERALQALRLRGDGLSWQEIADQLGYAGHESAQHAARSALERRLLAVEQGSGS